MKLCSKCKKEKDFSEYNKNSSRRDGLNGFCRDCMKTYLKGHYSNNKLGYYEKRNRNRALYLSEFLDYLSDKSCIDCGNKDKRVLEFDHLYGKSFNISEKVGMVPLKTLMKEISKCEIVCANCHKIRTSDSQGWYKN